MVKMLVLIQKRFIVTRVMIDVLKVTHVDYPLHVVKLNVNTLITSVFQKAMFLKIAIF